MATTTLDFDIRDYSLVGPESKKAVEKGLADANWYTCPVPRDEMRSLLTRKDGPAIRDTLIWFVLLIGMGLWGASLWGSWWAIIPFAIYGVVYASSSDSRWHESSHGTAFKTDWMNNALYEIASFMVFRESTPWRWSHARHHSDTIIVGRDPEIAVPRPPHIPSIVLNFFGVKAPPNEFRKMCLHAMGKMEPQEATYIPESEFPKVFFKARIYVTIYASVVGLAIYHQSFLPLMFIGLPTLYGSWLMPIYGLTQHAGLAENVLDHRLNCRTVYMNPIHRFLYWNMNYHVEHHMFPLVPYHALPKLHALIKNDCPPAYPNIITTFREIIPAVLQQVKDPTFHVKRELPILKEDTSQTHYAVIHASASDSDNGWIRICPSIDLHPEDVLRVDCDHRTFAVYRTEDKRLYATEGICTHGRTHLAEGLVKGNQIECAKHNGRFDVRDGSIQRPPVCVGLTTYKVEERDRTIYLDLNSAGGCGKTAAEQSTTFRVVSNELVATFIKELVLEPIQEQAFQFQPGDYIQLIIPEHETYFKTFEVPPPYHKTWQDELMFNHYAKNTVEVRRNYSMATNPNTDIQLRFNVRIATPPQGQAYSAGVGSTYVFNLKPGDTVRALGPFGEFHIQDTDREMIYIGGGAGMAPLRSHLATLFESHKTHRQVSFWYGARSKQELYYQDYFEDLASQHPNFSFHVALSEALPEDQWDSYTGFIHSVADKEYLAKHQDPTQIEFYLCGPPPMIQATIEMLKTYKIPEANIAYDEF